MNKTVVVIDAGGRGAALVQAYSKSPHVGKIVAIPGNNLMQINSKKPVVTYQYIKTTEILKILQMCKKENADLIDVAQDNAVAAGLADSLISQGFNVVGPTKNAGEIEWNKAFSREFMSVLGIPQPEYYIFDSVEKGIEFLSTQKDQSWFVKAAGLCEGKGALPAKNNAEAEERIVELQKFKEAAKTYLLEKWIKNKDEIAEEFSAFAISDGNTFQIVGYAQDHKRALDGDLGENTGGMGCSTPPLVIDKNIKDQTHEILEKTFEGMKKEGRPYKGVLYLGGIIINSRHPGKPQFGAHPGSHQDSGQARMTGKKVYVIEYNARWGDPEAEVIVPGIKNDFYELMMALVEEKLDNIKIKLDDKARVSVAVAAKGYPKDYSKVKGKEVIGIEKALKTPGVNMYGAGVSAVILEQAKRSDRISLKTKRSYQGLQPFQDDKLKKYVVSSGRVIHVVGEGKNVIDAREKVYKALKYINIEGDNMHYRTDIGWRDLKRLDI